jgi:hypothetical protein
MTHEQMKHLWRLLGQTWGSKFAENYGPAPNDAWQAALQSISPDQAKHALKMLIQAGSPFPPTLPEFMADARRYRTPPAPPERMLGNSVPPEQAAENIKRLRELMKSSGVH